MGTEEEIRMLLEGVLLGMVIIWYVQTIVDSRKAKKNNEKLSNNIKKLNTDGTTKEEG